MADSACSRPQRLWERLRDEHGVEVSARQLCRYVRAPGMQRLALAARMAADTAVRDSIVADAQRISAS